MARHRELVARDPIAAAHGIPIRCGSRTTSYRKPGDPAQALLLWSDVVQRGRKVFTHGEWDLAQFLYRKGETEAQLGRSDAARASLTESVTLFEAALGPANSRTRAAQSAVQGLARAGH
jgi:hypothetical protein